MSNSTSGSGASFVQVCLDPDPDVRARHGAKLIVTSSA
jgi:hypothetical protein